MSKSAAYKKSASRLRDELRNRISATTSNGIEKDTADVPPQGLKGREIGMWYAQRNKRRKEQGLADGGDNEGRTKMVSD